MCAPLQGTPGDPPGYLRSGGSREQGMGRGGREPKVDARVPGLSDHSLVGSLERNGEHPHLCFWVESLPEEPPNTLHSPTRAAGPRAFGNLNWTWVGMGGEQGLRFGPQLHKPPTRCYAGCSPAPKASKAQFPGATACLQVVPPQTGCLASLSCRILP